MENDVCIAPAYGAQAACVRWCAVHHRHGFAQAPAHTITAHLEEPQEEAQVTTRDGLAYKLKLPWLWPNFGWLPLGSVRPAWGDNLISCLAAYVLTHVSKQAGDWHTVLVKMRSKGLS